MVTANPCYLLLNIVYPKFSKKSTSFKKPDLSNDKSGFLLVEVNGLEPLTLCL